MRMAEPPQQPRPARRGVAWRGAAWRGVRDPSPLILAFPTPKQVQSFPGVLAGVECVTDVDPMAGTSVACDPNALLGIVHSDYKRA